MGGGEGIAGNFHFFETWEWIKKRLSHPVIFSNNLTLFGMIVVALLPPPQILI